MESNQESTSLSNELEKSQKGEKDSRKLRDEFDSQRAKFKELFLQKENELLLKSRENEELREKLSKLQLELDDLKSQLVVTNITLESSLESEKKRAESEIASLQRLIHEAVEESSSSKNVYDSEIRKLQNTILVLEHEMEALKSERNSVQGQSSGLAPSVMLSAVTKTLARKLGADVFSSQEGECYQKIERDDDHTREDPEVLRSLVVPLEEEIKALKDKLRATDERLQKCKQCRHVTEYETPRSSSHHSLEAQPEELKKSASDTEDMATVCDMCRNYEAQLVREQQKVNDLQNKVLAAEKAAEKHREELLKEIGFRKDMEDKWNEKKEEHKQQVAELTRRTECAEQDLKEAQTLFKQVCTEVEQKLKDLIDDREKVSKELIRLQTENENLVGKYTAHSQELQGEMINLPNTVEELQEVMLKTIQELIIAKVGKESAEKQVSNLQMDIMLLRDQLTNDQQERESLENCLTAEIETLKKQSHIYEKEKRQYLGLKEKILSLQEALGKKSAQLEDAIRAKKVTEQHNSELRAQISSLQQELDNSEAVQKDFVRLSQSLQVQLEKIRDSDNQVRWQYEDDVDECPGCRISFNSSSKRKKQNCRHCGQVYCTHCLTHVVLSGPNQRPSHVCDVCHTLLVKSSAPYFSTEVPHSPD